MTAPRRSDGKPSRPRRPSRPRNAGPPPRRTGPQGPPPADPARAAALELLTTVRERDAYANLALPSILRRARLSGRDAALATELGYGACRAKGLLDSVIAACATRSLSNIESLLLDALRLGTYQLLRTRVPAHAAVDSTVELVRARAGSRSAGFVNAILRKVGERTEAEWVAQLAPDAETDPIGHLAFAHAHPVWIAQAFVDALAGSSDEIAELLAADDARPSVHLMARPGVITAEELALASGGEEAPYSPYGVRLDAGSGDPGDLDAVTEGLAVVVDEGSQLVALGLANASLVGPDTGRWLDLCAGPGGKAAILAGLVELDGGTLDAVEPAEHRAELVRRATAGLPVTVHVGDGRSAPVPEGEFDRVLVDVPCTGLGALRRRPEARWRREPSDVAGLTSLQRELLTAALRHVRVGGVVAYATCSPHVAETHGVLASVLRKHPEFERLDTRESFPKDMPALGDGPSVQLWPHRHGTDAMFLALLRRT
ncbi:RsmB/NOP family class I SAM-dependent RNA methyltransferase [Pseudonocardia spinosispora]|uniref:RsmB/NOP family class I SAM-dependent RNA methyltransferase n=1 Tax=Pseudonocardia spinosispora TaxID=103441 RepID=UPI0006843C29|nr:transcription antitermination factor NusB [Pseudonocardia spinosispora]